MYNNRRFVLGPGGELHDCTLMPWSEKAHMTKPYVCDDILKSWIVFPSEQARRAYVQAVPAVKALTIVEAERIRRLQLLVEALSGELTAEEPTP